MICVHCDYDFDPKSTLKQMAGGKINECADCVEELGTETAVKYLGTRPVRLTGKPGIITTGCTKERLQPSLVPILR